MPSVTLVESAKLSLNELVSGIIENVITVNPFFEILPFNSIDGNALQFTRENALGDAQFLGIDGTVTAKNPATFTSVSVGLTTLIADAEVNGLIAATRSNEGNDQVAIQIGSKAKSIGRTFQQYMITGDGTSDSFTGLNSLCAAGQQINATNGQQLSLNLLDNLLDLVTDQDGVVDYIQMSARSRNLYFGLLREAGGRTIGETVELPGGTEVPSYRGTPIFRNDYISNSETSGSSSNTSRIYAGTLDDGSMTHGISGLTAANMAGIKVVDVGEKELQDNRIWRIKWYCALANFSQKGLAMATDIQNTIS